MSLLYNVSQLLKSEIGKTRVYDFETNETLDLDGSTATEVTGRVKFILTNFSILATVNAQAMLHLTCARCLEEFSAPTEVHFEEEYQPLVDINTGLPSKSPRSDTAFIITQSHTVDLTEALRQNLLLAVEMVPLCSRDCLGLCPVCGLNRNADPGHHHEAESNSPFAALQGLLTDPKPD
jgi:uncharacterized protein